MNKKVSKKQINIILEKDLLNTNLNGAFIAQELGVNRMYIHRILKKYYNLNAGEIILHKRIEYAKKQLLKTNLPIYLIAQELNFYDAAHFSKTFKKLVGMTPYAYRNHDI